MKKLLFIISVAACCFLSACNNTAPSKGEMSEAARKNLEAFRAVSNAFDTGDVSRIDSVVASDFVDHTDRGDVVGTDSLKAAIAMIKKSSSNMKSEEKKVLVDDDYVMGWMRWTGTSDGSMPGMPAGPYDMTGLEVVRFKDGKAVEHWAFMEPREMMKMMGAGQQMPPSSPASTDQAK